jgi:multicomponent K+:H+ antiporter subunit A
MSAIAIGMGLMLLAAQPALQRLWDRTPKPEAKRLFDATLGQVVSLARRATTGLHNGSLSRGIVLALVALLAAIWAAIWAAEPGDRLLEGGRALVPVQPVPVLIWLMLMGATLVTVLLHRNRLLALMLVGVIGLGVSIGFAYFSAPDLAITQITVEVVTILLMLLALNLLPKEAPAESHALRRGRDAVLAGFAGVGMAGLSYALMTRAPAFDLMSAFHLAQSKPGAGGTNAVNTIIVDFRGFDTYGEIIVLGIAGVIIFALVEALLRSLPARILTRAVDRATANAGDPHPLMMVVAARVILPMAMLVGVYIYLRGHNLPGGGFVAGLVFAIALILQFVASGLTWGQARQRFDFHLIIAAGVVVASLCGMGAWLFGLPFLTSGYDYVDLWPLEKFELATAAIFDLGVFLCVLGAVMLTLASFARLAATRAPEEETP